MVNPITAARAESRRLLTEVEAKQMLAAAGIPVAVAHLATSADEAVARAGEVGYPVVMKVVSTEIAHKSDVGGVAVGLADAEAVRAEYAAMLDRVTTAAPGASVEGVAVQEMARAGTEVIVGATTDPQFGLVMMFGLGGVFVEVLKDVAFRLVPLDERDARQLVRDIKGLPILQGVRGQPPADLAALERLILQVSAFLTEHPDIAELDLNPVFAYEDGVIAVDARIVLSEPAAQPANA